MRLLIWDSDGTLGYRPSGEWSSAMDETAETKVPTLGVEPEDLAPHLQSGFPWHHPTCAQIDTASSDAWWSSLHPILRATFPPVGGDLARAHTPGTRAAPVSIQVAHASPLARCPPWTDGWRTDGSTFLSSKISWFTLGFQVAPLPSSIPPGSATRSLVPEPSTWFWSSSSRPWTSICLATENGVTSPRPAAPACQRSFDGGNLRRRGRCGGNPAPTGSGRRRPSACSSPPRRQKCFP